jgi:hypothetical protein
MDCWTFFEIALSFARMLNEPESNWTTERLLHYIELDRYRGGQCTGEYLSRLHYLEDWLYDNDRRGLVEDLTRSLGGRRVPHSAREMSVGWRHYRYLAANRSLLGPLGRMEANVSSRPLYEIPKNRVAGIEPKLRSGDIIGIISRDRNGLYSTAHVGLALRTNDGVLHFMHASSPGNYGHVIVDTRLSKYLYRHRSDSGSWWHGRCGNRSRRFAVRTRLRDAPQQFLYFLPLPHGHGSLRPTFPLNDESIERHLARAIAIPRNCAIAPTG